MLPEFLFAVGNSMQEISRDDFNLLNVANGCEKEMCLAVQRLNTSPPLAPSIGPPPPNGEHEHEHHFDSHAVPHSGISPLNGIKLEDTTAVDLFPTHPTTWQQHPMNSLEHAHHRLAHQHPQHASSHHHHHHHQHYAPHRYANGSSKLLLQSSDDPLICRGANSVGVDDDQPLIAAVGDGEQRQQGAPHTMSPPLALALLSRQQTPTPPQPQPQQQKRPQNGCSSLTKQQLKVKAGLMSAQNQAHAQSQCASAVACTAGHATAKPRTPKPAKKKGVLKLRFHHQALPPEYLSHYEATQAQIAQRAKEAKESSAAAPHTVKISHTAKLPPAKSTHENVRSWLQKIAEIQRSAHQQQQPQEQHQKPTATQQQHHPAASTESNCSGHALKSQSDPNNNHQLSRMQTQSAPSPVANGGQRTVIVHTPRAPPPEHSAHFAPLATAPPKPTTSPTKGALIASLGHSHKRVVNYADLPYMGEITLDNSKPRRGRKPKKADICHLIYKNYGTIFPGTPKGVLDAEESNAADLAAKLKPGGGPMRVEEPLNLCLRDQSTDLYSISSEDDDDALASEPSTCATPTANMGVSALDAATDTLLAANMKVSMHTLSANETLLTLKREPERENPTPIVVEAVAPGMSATSAAELLLHPVSVYYQKLIESGTLLPQNVQPFGLPIETIEKDNQLSLKIPIPSGLFVTPKVEKTSPAPSAHTTLDYPEPMSTPSSIKSEQSSATNATSNSTSTGQQLAPQKRKRSAIFIPPIPAENTTNPATEVSICKFKFTGGAKPTLQEKKMLSVDSDGNYRYYSGTGDKSMRGYEFFPRESLQHSAGLLPGVNCTGAFLNATGEKIAHDIPPPSAGLSNELLHIPESPTGTLLPHTAIVPEPVSPGQLTASPLPAYGVCANLQQHHNSRNAVAGKSLWHHATVSNPNSPAELTRTTTHSPGGQHAPEASCSAGSSHRPTVERKKKSRRSAQREKLEKTFKEKGFLIQTQQLESAEGATYCKFRQLKKFTRYLFRNWKDYLPDDLQQVNAAAAAAAAAAAVALNKRDNGVETAAAQQQQQSAFESILAQHGFVGDNGVGALKDAAPAGHGHGIEQPL